MPRKMLETRWVWVLLLGGALAAAGCTTAPQGNDNGGPTPECVTDDDCLAGEVCDDGECFDAPANANDNTPANTNDNGTQGPDGEALFTANCAGCHGADGTGGLGPDITGLTADELITGLQSATHDSVADLTEEEVAAIAEFLGQ